MISSRLNKLLLLSVLPLAGCVGTKNISPDDPLYVGHAIVITSSDATLKNLSSVKSVMKPEPNNRFLWMRPSLARYNMLSETAKKKKFWKNKIDVPVLLSQTNPAKVAKAIQNRIFHLGYFQNTVSYDTILKGQRKAKLQYTITPGKPYRFESIVFSKPADDLTQIINNHEHESLLKSGDIYTLDAVKNERIRIDEHLNERGFIYFNPEFIKVNVDTVSGNHQINASIVIKPETPPESRIPYTIRKVFIYDDHALDFTPSDTVRSGNYYFISKYNSLNIEALQRGIFLKPGDLYSRSNYMHTIRYLNDLPLIRNTNVKFLPYVNTDSLDVVIYLSQRKRYAYTAEFNAIFRSTNYFGPGTVLSYTDRNRSKGSEMLKINLRGRVEGQIVEGKVNPAYELGVEVNYRIPRFYPDFLFGTTKKNLPKTNISVGYNLFNRLDLYRLNSVFANYGYRWSRNDRVAQSANPVEIIYTRIPETSKSDEFKEYLEQNPGVQRSFDEQFIIGAGYEFIYQTEARNLNDFFFRAGVDVSGNILKSLYSAIDGPKDSLGRYTLVGVPFSQYIRPRFDIRYSINLRQSSKLVARFSAGVGIPLGNSQALPYIKQFYVGGTNSLRSFLARSVGPGGETPPDGYNDLTGDIRLEGNLEFRFDVAGDLKGALFIDAGNIWLFNDDPSRPKGTFRLNTFVDDIAISSGWGLRWDFNFIVARLDFAYTIRTPYLPSGEKWITDFKFWTPAINIAIGYPF